MSHDLPPPGASFLLVDDDPRLRDRLALALADRGYRVRVANGPPDALALVDEESPDFALVDLKMPDGDGLALVADLRERAPDARVVVLTGYGSIATAVDAVRLGALDYLSKPADTDMILAAFARVSADPREETREYEPPSLDRAEWEHIQRVLDDCGGNISKAARKLGLHRRTLQRKLDRYAPRR